MASAIENGYMAAGRLAALREIRGGELCVPSRQASCAAAVRSAAVVTMTEFRAFRRGWFAELNAAGVEVSL